MTWRAWFDEVTEGVVTYSPMDAEALGIACCAYCREWRAREDLVAMEYRAAQGKEGLEPTPAKVWWRCVGCGKEWA